MDFIVELPERGRGNTVVWVVTDRFLKQKSCPQIPSSKTLAKLFVQHVFRLRGAPDSITSDRGVQFTSQFWQECFKLLLTVQGLNSSHHPQTNRVCDKDNLVPEQYFRCYINYQQDNWADHPFTEVAYNNSVHSSTGFTPFKDFVAMPELPQQKTQIPSWQKMCEI